MCCCTQFSLHHDTRRFGCWKKYGWCFEAEGRRKFAHCDGAVGFVNWVTRTICSFTFFIPGKAFVDCHLAIIPPLRAARRGWMRIKVPRVDSSVCSRKIVARRSLKRRQNRSLVQRQKKSQPKCCQCLPLVKSFLCRSAFSCNLLPTRGMRFACQKTTTASTACCKVNFRKEQRWWCSGIEAHKKN